MLTKKDIRIAQKLKIKPEDLKNSGMLPTDKEIKIAQGLKFTSKNLNGPAARKAAMDGFLEGLK